MSSEHETLEETFGYSEEIVTTPISNCPYCGLKRQIIHIHDEMYGNPDSYKVEHVDEIAAVATKCPDVMWAYNNLNDAVRYANMRAIEDGKAKVVY